MRLEGTEEEEEDRTSIHTKERWADMEDSDSDVGNESGEPPQAEDRKRYIVHGMEVDDERSTRGATERPRRRTMTSSLISQSFGEPEMRGWRTSTRLGYATMYPYKNVGTTRLALR